MKTVTSTIFALFLQLHVLAQVPPPNHLHQYDEAVTITDSPRSSNRGGKSSRAAENDGLIEYLKARIAALEQDSTNKEQELQDLRALLDAASEVDQAREREREIAKRVLINTLNDKDSLQSLVYTLQAEEQAREALDSLMGTFHVDYLTAYPAYPSRNRNRDRSTGNFDKWEYVVVEFMLSSIGQHSLPDGKFRIMVQDQRTGEYLFHEEGTRTNSVSFHYYGGVASKRFSVRNTKYSFEQSQVFIVKLFYEDHPLPIRTNTIEFRR